jgi:cytoskeletal protein RodZ
MFELFVVDVSVVTVVVVSMCELFKQYFFLYSTHDNIADSNSNHSQVLRIDCDAPMTTEQTTEKITTSDAPQSSPQTPVSEKSTTNSSNIDTTL